jgi:hypothetical protein
MGGSPLLVHVLLTCGCLHTTRSKAGLMAIDVARVRRREDICGIIARHVNSHPDHVVRMEFASLLFPKKGQITDVDHDLALLMGPEGDEGGSALARVEEEEEEDGEAEAEEDAEAEMEEASEVAGFGPRGVPAPRPRSGVPFCARPEVDLLFSFFF